MSETGGNRIINLLMLNYEFPPLGGGAGNANYYILKELAKYPELNIDLVTSSTGSFKVEAFSKNITVHFLDINKQGKNLHYQTNREVLNYSLKAYRYAKNLQKQKSYDLCHAYFGIPCGFIALLLKLPYIVSLRGSDVPTFNKRYYWLDKLFFKQLSKITWKRARKVVANSEGLKELAHKTAPEQVISVIYNGVDVDQFSPPANKNINDPVKLISTGRLIARKGYIYLLEALKSNENIELTLIGDGNLAAELQEHAKKNNMSVRFPGRIAHQNLADHLRDADIFVLPSLNEGMPNSVLEAMACGLPVVVTDTGGSRELIKNNGYIVKKADIDALKKALENLLYNRDLIIEMGRRSRKIAEDLSWKEVAKGYYEIYLQLAQADYLRSSSSIRKQSPG